MRKIAQIIAQNNTVQGKNRWYQINLYVERKTNTIKKSNQSGDGISALWEQKEEKKYTPEYVKKTSICVTWYRNNKNKEN